ncbi:MAG: lysophospholipid acyltransferase family protein [Gemmatimonadota bacterium]
MLRSSLFFAWAAVSTLFFSAVAVAGGLLGAPKGLYDWVHRHWARGLLRVAGVQVRVSGLENLRREVAQILVCNHQSMFDIWVLMAALPVSLRFVAKQELSRIPVFARACRSAGHVFIERQDRAGSIEAIRAAGARMREEGLSLVFFPEGTRSPDGRLRAFKRGTFVLAIETQATLVPVAVDGGARILGRGDRRLRSGQLLVRCGAPIPLAGRTAEDRDEVLKESRASIERMLAELRTGGGLSGSRNPSTLEDEGGSDPTEDGAGGARGGEAARNVGDRGCAGTGDPRLSR